MVLWGWPGRCGGRDTTASCGMQAYRASGGRHPLRFVLVGGDRTEMPGFLAQVKSLGLTEDVLCPGFQTGDELNHTTVQRMWGFPHWDATGVG